MSLTGSGAALISGPLQFNGQLRRERQSTHRLIGCVYVGAILISSVTALLLIITFDVSLARKIALSVVPPLWTATTVIALWRILERDVPGHGEWMARSFSLTLFFVTFSLWVPGLQATALPSTISYPLGVFLSWSLNLVAAELWIRRTRLELARSLVPRQKRELDRRHARGTTGSVCPLDREGEGDVTDSALVGASQRRPRRTTGRQSPSSPREIPS